MTERERKSETQKAADRPEPAPIRLESTPEAPATGWSPTAWRQGRKDG
jgi:hypothetical protein